MQKPEEVVLAAGGQQLRGYPEVGVIHHEYNDRLWRLRVSKVQKSKQGAFRRKKKIVKNDYVMNYLYYSIFSFKDKLPLLMSFQ
jgi:stalled ribosome alternative rescue factor ArfA